MTVLRRGLYVGLAIFATVAVQSAVTMGTGPLTAKPRPAPRPAAVLVADEPIQAAFGCQGSAPQGVAITYGADGDQLEGGSLPFSSTLSLDGDRATTYAVTAQLLGSGTVRCTATVEYTNNRTASKTATTLGGYGVAMVQVCNLATTNWRPC